MSENAPERDAFGNYLVHERRMSAHTVRNYLHALQCFETWMREHARWSGDYAAVSTPQVRAFLLFLGKERSRRTVHNQVSGLRTFYRFLQERKGVEVNPFVGLTLPKLDKPLPKFLTEKQMRALLEAPMQMMQCEHIKPFQAWRDRLVMEMLYGGGLRISELMALNHRDIDGSDGTARVLGKGNKTRICPLGRVAMACLNEYRKYSPRTTPDDPLLVNAQGERLGARRVQRLLKSYLEAAGLPMDMTPHKLRHSYATHMLSEGANLRMVQELLGHASLSTTQIYTHVDMKRLKAAHTQAHPRA